jgi:two-component system NtrC family sensor kinase
MTDQPKDAGASSPGGHRPLPRGVRARILAAFVVLVAGVGLTSLLSIRTHDQVHGEFEAVARAERGIRYALELAAEARDFYAHQAHTVILNDRSHLHFYGHARHGVEDALAATLDHDPAPEDRRLLEEIGAMARELDRNFNERILPGIGGDREALLEPHARALELSDGIVARVNRLTERLRERAEAARDRAAAAERAATRRTWIFLLAAVGFSLAAGIYIHRSIADPLRGLAEGAGRIAGGDLKTRLGWKRRDEFGFLAGRFDEMAEELARRQEALIHSEKLAGIGRLASGVAHEINNPLAVILGYARLIARGGDEGTRADAAVIVEEVERCQEIVAGLLDLSRPPRLAPAPVDLADLAREVGERVREVQGRGAVVVSADGPVEAVADEGKVRQILANLIRNALEADPEGKVEVTVGREGDRAVVRVRDHGPGLSPEARARLFEPFHTTKPKGTGLGLAVSASLARAHGGTLAPVDSGGPGACFELSLPVSAEARSA